MRLVLNILLVIVMSVSGLAAPQYSTKSRTHNTEVPERKTDDKAKAADTKKQDVPPPAARKTEEKKAEVPQRKADGNKPAEEAEPAPQPKKPSIPVENSRYDGIDVSRHQKTIDWQLLATDKNVKYVYIKATEGQNFVDPKYRENLENARKAGFKVGSYHFMRTTSPIRAQFANFTRNVKKHEQDLLPLLDVEVRQGWTYQQLRDSVKLFVDLLEEHYGCKPMIYTSSSYYNNILGRLFAEYPLFIARYSASEPKLDGGVKWILWQYSDKGRLRGIDHAVDLSRFNTGFSIRDIMMKDNKVGHSKRRNADVVDKSHEKPAKVDVKKETPALSKKQKEELKKQQEREAKARERAEKLKQEEEKKKREEEKKRQEKERKEQLEREKRAAREQATRKRVQSNFQNTTDYQKQAELKQRQAEQQAKEREKAEKQAAKEREKAEKQAREKAEKQAREKAEKQAREKAEKLAREKAEAEARAKEEKAQQEAKAKEEARAKARAEAQAKAQAEVEAEKQAEAKAKAQQQKKQEQKALRQQQKAASTSTTTTKGSNTSTSTATPTRKRTNKSSADND